MCICLYNYLIKATRFVPILHLSIVLKSKMNLFWILVATCSALATHPITTLPIGSSFITKIIDGNSEQFQRLEIAKVLLKMMSGHFQFFFSFITLTLCVHQSNSPFWLEVC